METEPNAKKTLPITGRRLFYRIVLTLALTFAALATLSFAGGVDFNPSKEKFNIIRYIYWIIRVWTPFIFAFSGLCVWRSVWRSRPRTWASLIPRAIPYVLNAFVILIYIVSPFWLLFVICCIGG